MKSKQSIFRFLVISLLMTSGPALIFGQNHIDIFKVGYSIGPNNNFTEGDNTTDVNQWVIDATLPIVLSDKNTIITGVLFENIKVKFDEESDEATLYTINLKLGLNHTYSDKWSASYILLPKFASDLKQQKGEDFQMGLFSLFKFKKQSNLHYKFGVLYNTELSGPFLVPFAGLYYQKGKWETNLLLPLSADLSYRLADPLKVGIQFNGLIKSFNLNEPYKGKSAYMSRSNNEVGGYLGLAMGRINLIGFVGTSIGRRFRIYEQDDKVSFALASLRFGDERTQLNNDFNDGLVINTSLIYRIGVED